MGSIKSILGKPEPLKQKEHVKLTGPEHSVNVAQMNEHRGYRCGRCTKRCDFESGRYVCMKGMNAEYVMKNDKVCGNFSFNEDITEWRGDL